MQDSLNIPEKIKIGFNKRKDTYTGKLAYITWIDKKGKLRKENSWTGWKDDNIPVEDYVNEPTDGFVLNKDVGGTQRCYSWNARREKFRVYDPRGFEFEITGENLLFILQECSSIKGKGLEGEFVYSWSGAEIVLLPVGSEEYKSSVEFNDMQTKKVTKKDMIEGCTYLNKNRQNVMYMGRHPWFENKYVRRGGDYTNVYTGKPKHIFLLLDDQKKESWQIIDAKRERYWIQTGFTKLAARTSDSPVPQYADEYEKLMATTYVTKPTGLVIKELDKNVWDKDRYYSSQVCVEFGDNIFVGYLRNHHGGIGSYLHNNKNPRRYDVECDKVAVVKDGEYYEEFDNRKGFYKNNISEEEAKAIVKALYVKCDNGSEFKITSY